MASKRLVDIPHCDGRLTIDPDSSHPVGSLPGRQFVTFTRIETSSEMTVEYAGEESGFAVWHRPIEIRRRDLEDDESLTIRALEVTTRRTQFRRDTAAIAYYPYHLDWFGLAPFKPVQKRARIILDQAIDRILAAARESNAPFRDCENSIWAAIESIPSDPFGGEGQLYSRVRELRTDHLARAEGETTPSDRVSLHGLTKPNREPDEAPEIYFGIAEDPQGCRALIRETELIGSMMDSINKGHLTIGARSISIFPTTQSLARSLLEASIVKALAGPSENYRAKIQKYSRFAKRVGGVTMVAKSIFEDQLLNLNRRLGRKAKDETPFFNEPIKAGGLAGPVDNEPEGVIGSLDLAAKVDAVWRILSSRSFDASVFWHEVNRLLMEDDEQSMAVGCAYAAAGARIVVMPSFVAETIRSVLNREPENLAAKLALGLAS
jgi:hypothetical protein